MNKDEVINKATELINQKLAGQEVESPKVDFKRSWYNLQNEPPRMQFLKDACAIANTVGLDGLIIFGVDDKTNELLPVSFSQSGLKDTSELNGILNRYISSMFELNYFEFKHLGQYFGLMHIPPSIDKPHAITCYKTFDKVGQPKNEYKHEIFVRKGSATAIATKYDLDLMYYDRKNILPEHEVKISTNRNASLLTQRQAGVIVQARDHLFLNFENTGRRPVAIVGINYIRAVYDDSRIEEDLEMYADLMSSPIVLQPNTIASKRIEFSPPNYNNLHYRAEKFSNCRSLTEKPTVALKISTGAVLTAKFTFLQ